MTEELIAAIGKLRQTPAQREFFVAFDPVRQQIVEEYADGFSIADGKFASLICIISVNTYGTRVADGTHL